MSTFLAVVDNFRQISSRILGRLSILSALLLAQCIPTQLLRVQTGITQCLFPKRLRRRSQNYPDRPPSHSCSMARKPKRSQRAYGEWASSDKQLEQNHNFITDLSVPLEYMSADSLNLWLCKFICEVAKQTGKRYSPKTLYLFVCGINRHLGNVQGEKAFNILEKSDMR